MSLELFEGAAGTGKTTKLIERARQYLSSNPLQLEQRVLALTKFHGSRKRMSEKLAGPKGLGVPIDCITIDSFSRHLIRRWRSLASRRESIPDNGDFQAITSLAGTLLRAENVGAWVKRRYPIVIVDEMQDCNGSELEVLRGLEKSLHVLAAADAFQDLSGSYNNEAVNWAKSHGEVDILQRIHRTSIAGLLDAAEALRLRKPLPVDRLHGFEIRTVPKAPMGGAIVSWKIKSWSRFGDIAIISPTRPEKSPFVKSIVEWVNSKVARTQNGPATAGPYSVSWEAADATQKSDLILGLNLPEDSSTLVSCQDLAVAALRLGAADVHDWLDKQRRVGGRNWICTAEVTEQIGRLVTQRRAFGRSRTQKRIALTVHQAKNREFESVIILWPLKMQTEPEQQRRLLYNAITRAKRQAIIIVEDPFGNRGGRLLKSPFTVN